MAPRCPPFFAALRRRHPDVDLVLLPPEGAGAEVPGEPVDDDAPGRRDGPRLAADAAALLGGRRRRGREPPSTGFGYGPDPGQRRGPGSRPSATARRVAVPGRSRPRARARGWTVRRPAGAVARAGRLGATAAELTRVVRRRDRRRSCSPCAPRRCRRRRRAGPRAGATPDGGPAGRAGGDRPRPGTSSTSTCSPPPARSAAASTGGFTAAVSGAAARFATAWERRLDELGAGRRGPGRRAARCRHRLPAHRPDGRVRGTALILDVLLREAR